MEVWVDITWPRGGILLPYMREDAVCARRIDDGAWVIVQWSPALPVGVDGLYVVPHDDVLAELEEPWQVRSWTRYGTRGVEIRRDLPSG